MDSSVRWGGGARADRLDLMEVGREEGVRVTEPHPGVELSGMAEEVRERGRASTVAQVIVEGSCVQVLSAGDIGGAGAVLGCRTARASRPRLTLTLRRCLPEARNDGPDPG